MAGGALHRKAEGGGFTLTDPNHRAPRGVSPGVALLEVIVALALLASVGLVLFDWLRQSLATASRAREWQARVEVELNAQALMKAVNPSLKPEGRTSVAGLSVAWRSKPLMPLRPILVPSPDSGGYVAAPWKVGLYEVEVTASYRPSGSGQPGVDLSYSAVAVGTAGSASGVAAP